MSKTIELRTVLREQLLQACAQVHYTENLLDDDAAPQYPYCIFSAREIDKTDCMILGEVEVNVVDLGPDTAQAERIADEIQQKLDHFCHLGKAVGFWLYPGIRQPVQDENKRLIRRRLTFELHLMERS